MNQLPVNWTRPEAPRTEGQLERRRSVVPILITMGVAFALLAGSVFGALSTCGSMNSGLSPAFKFFSACVLFFFGVLVLSVAWLALSLIIKVIQYFKDSGSQ
jgi:hypothetical protein